MSELGVACLISNAVLHLLLELRNLPSDFPAEVQTLFRNYPCVDRLLGGGFKAADNHKAAPAKTP